MSDWKTKLKEAKELFDDGIIEKDEFEHIKKNILKSRGLFFEDTMSSSKTSPLEIATQKEDTFGQITSKPPNLSRDTFAITTRFGEELVLSKDNIFHLLAGTRFDERYTIVSPVGKGGMGMVYQAVDTTTRQSVALKVLHPHFFKQGTMLDYLVQEVSLGQKLNHPNLLQIRHLETRSSSPYLIMELMDEDLQETVTSKGGSLAPQETLEILRAVCSGLSALHKEKILHLDVKPQNILLAKGGKV